MQSGRWLQNLEKPVLSIIKFDSDKAGFSETFLLLTRRNHNPENSNLDLNF